MLMCRYVLMVYMSHCTLEIKTTIRNSLVCWVDQLRFKNTHGQICFTLAVYVPGSDFNFQLRIHAVEYLHQVHIGFFVLSL